MWATMVNETSGMRVVGQSLTCTPPTIEDTILRLAVDQSATAMVASRSTVTYLKYFQGQVV